MDLENLFRPGSDEGHGDEQPYEAKLPELARVIEIDPEVLAVQEVGDPEALEDLRAPRHAGRQRSRRPPSTSEDPTDRREEPASDHAPVWARFDLG